MASAHLTHDQHIARIERHTKVGDALAAAGDEWAVVCWFYAAYHVVLCALKDDPTFDTLEDCQARHADLVPEDRFTTTHKSRKGAHTTVQWGVNDLVGVLYKPAVGTYDRMHQLSIQVRYGNGLTGDIGHARAVWDKFLRLQSEGALTSAVD